MRGKAQVEVSKKEEEKKTKRLRSQAAYSHYRAEVGPLQRLLGQTIRMKKCPHSKGPKKSEPAAATADAARGGRSLKASHSTRKKY